MTKIDIILKIIQDELDEAIEERDKGNLDSSEHQEGFVDALEHIQLTINNKLEEQL